MRVIPQKIKKQVVDFLDNTYNEKVNVITPDSLTKEQLLKCKPPHIDDEQWVQNCRWIVHSIIEQTFDKRFTINEGDFVPLYSKILKENCGNSYKGFIIGLMDCGVIEGDGEYSSKRHESFGFRLTEKYEKSPLKYITLSDTFLVKRIRNYRKKRIAELKEKAAPIAHLVRWLTYKKLTLDKEAALTFLETYKRKLTNELAKRQLKPKYKARQTAFIMKRYNRIKFQIENWEGHKPFSIDDSAGRLYSSITSLPSLFRNFLSYNTEELVSLDIKNSQPLHFLSMLKKEFWKDYTSGITLYKLNKDLQSYLQDQQGYPDNIMFHESHESLAGKGTDLYTFKKLVETGKLYEFICNRFFNKYKTKGGIDRFSTRSKSKKEFLHMMYHNPRAQFSSAKDVFSGFKTLFPFEAGIMSLMKKRKHNDFPIILQKIEAQMLLHMVAKKVFITNPDIPLFTIHDSIITTKQYGKIVCEILEEEYKSLLGILPQLETTEFTEHNAWNEISKYTKAKVDQADIEISNATTEIPDGLRFLKCEHWNFNKMYKQFTEEKGKLKVVEFADYNTIPVGLKKVSESQPATRRIKK